MNTKVTIPRALAVVVLIFAMVILFRSAPWLNSDTAVINGFVGDQSGAVVPGATIGLLNTGLVRTTTTNGSSTYDMGEIPPGVYTIGGARRRDSQRKKPERNVTLSLSQALVFNFEKEGRGHNGQSYKWRQAM